MADKNFDGLPALEGSVTTLTAIDPDGTPNKVVDADLDFKVKVSWTVSPAATAVLLDGKWTVRLFAESIGSGPEKGIGKVEVQADGGTSYTATITVAAGTLPPDSDSEAGIYELAAVIVYRNTSGVLTEMAAFRRGETVLVRKP